MTTIRNSRPLLAAAPDDRHVISPPRRNSSIETSSRDARAFAREDLVAVEVAAVGQGSDLLAPRGLLCLERHGCELVAVVPLINHLMGHDQMVLGIDSDLHIVADGSGAFAA